MDLRIVCAFDKFKGTLDAWSVCKSVAAGLKEGASALSSASGRRFNLSIAEIPLSDGGDGFVQLLSKTLGLKTTAMPPTVVGPLGPNRQPLLSPLFAMSSPRPSAAASSSSSQSDPTASGRGLAVLEMCAASGITLVPADVELDVMNATTFGVGQMIKHVYDLGARDIVIGLGGSATNDGGIGALQALGARVVLKDDESAESTEGEYPRVFGCGGMLRRISQIVMPSEPVLPGATIALACDVRNPFVGPHGAVAVFSRQKGATSEQQTELEEGMQHVARLLEEATGRSVAQLPGAGAAGGLAGGLHAMLNAPIVSGMELVEQKTQLEQSIAAADLVITGEGAFDDSSEDGKVVSKICALAKKHAKPVVIICGQTARPSTSEYRLHQLLSMFDLHTAMTQPEQCLKSLVEAECASWLLALPEVPHD